MRRAVCYCEPSQALAGELNTWRFIYTAASNLPKGTKFRLDMQSKGRLIDWEPPSADLNEPANIIYGIIGKGKPIPAKEVEVPQSFAPVYEFTLPNSLPSGEVFTIYVGAPKGDKGKKTEGNRAQTYTQRRRTFLLYVDPSGKGRYDEPETFTMDIRGNVMQTIRFIVPSFVVKNRRFDLMIRFEDEFGNLSSNAPDDTLCELSHDHIRENLKWKLFVPESGFIAIPNLYFNDPGVYTIKLYNTRTKETFISQPIRCLSENEKQLFWGVLHGESEKMDSTESIEPCLRHFRDEKALNFFAASPFENAEETPNETWKLISQNLTTFNEEYRFTTFLGFQWEGEPHKEGVRQFLFAKDNKPILRRKEPKSSSLEKIYKSFSSKELISIPCFTMAKGYEYNFDSFHPEFERVVEIYNSWGSSECTAKEGNPKPIQSTGKKGIQESAEGSIQKALQRNLRFGFVAGGLDDRGIYTGLYEGDQVQYSPGMTAIVANDHTREAIFDALYRRSCFATTGERIILGFFIAGSPMGSEINTSVKIGLHVNRFISGFVAGTTKLKSIEIIRNGKIIHKFKPNDYHMDFSYDDAEPLSNVLIQAKDKKPPFVYYYIRVTQEDGHMAWSSPIWIDSVPAAARPAPKSTPPLKKSQQKKLKDEEEEDDEFDDEDEDDFE